jgi:hypothetical protein
VGNSYNNLFCAFFARFRPPPQAKMRFLEGLRPSKLLLPYALCKPSTAVSTISYDHIFVKEQAHG